MRIPVLLFIILFSLLVSTAIASDWVQVYSDKEFTVYIDKQSIERGDVFIAKFWEKTVYKNQQMDEYSGKHYVQSKEYRVSYCISKEVATYEVHLYADDGSLVDSPLTFPTSHRIIPDSIEEVIYKYVCSFKQPPPAIVSEGVNVYSDKELTVHIDKQSIKGDVNSREFWEEITFDKEQMLSAGKYYIRVMQYVGIDCNNSLEKLHKITLYAIDGSVIDTKTLSPPHTSSITPNSVEEAVKEYVCSFKPTK